MRRLSIPSCVCNDYRADDCQRVFCLDMPVCLDYPEPVVNGRPTHTLLCNLILGIYARQDAMCHQSGCVSRRTLKELATELEIYKYPLLLMREHYGYGRLTDFNLTDETVSRYECFKDDAVEKTMSMIEILQKYSRFSIELTAALIAIYNCLIDGLKYDYWP